MAIAAVADGHGGDAYIRSDRGAQFAAQCALECIKEFIMTVRAKNINVASSPAAFLSQLEKSIIASWRLRVDADLAADPAEGAVENGNSLSRIYGSTLIAAAATESFWFGIQIGDGKCVVLNHDGSFNQPIPWDSNCFLNTTTSICDGDAAARFRHFFSTSLPAGVFIGTDGVDDSYPVADNEEHLSNLYRMVARNFMGAGFEQGFNELRAFLPRLTEKGSGDDVSIAGLIDMGALPGAFSNTRGEMIWADS